MFKFLYHKIPPTLFVQLLDAYEGKFWPMFACYYYYKMHIVKF